jgi:hypothetical protein
VAKKSPEPGPRVEACGQESPFDGYHGEEELVWVILERYKVVVKIEGVGGLVQSFYYNANRRYLRRVSPTSVQGIHQEKATELLVPAPTADGHPAEQGGRKKRIARKPPGDGVRQLPELNAISRESIVTENRTTACDHDERCGDFSSGILAGLMMDVTVEFRNARVERCPVVRIAEGHHPVLKMTRSGHRVAKFLRYSRAARRRTEPGSGGSRRAFAKISVSRAVRTNMARFSIARSAAASALCRTKSVMVRPSKSAAF